MVVATINEYNGVGEDQSLDVGNLNVGRLDDSELVPGPTNSIVAGTNSFEKYARIAFASIDNQVDNLQVWKSVGALHAEADLKVNTRTATQTGYVSDPYVQPTQTTSTVATFDVEEADPTEANLGLEDDDNLATPKTVDGESDLLVMQYQTTGSHPGGSITQMTLTFQWDEQ